MNFKREEGGKVQRAHPLQQREVALQISTDPKQNRNMCTKQLIFTVMIPSHENKLSSEKIKLRELKREIVLLKRAKQKCLETMGKFKQMESSIKWTIPLTMLGKWTST